MSEEPDFQHSSRGASFPGREARGLTLRMWAALLLALLAPALGGGTSVMAVAVLLAGVGLVVVGLPARGLRVGFLIGAGLVLVVALGWAWPARFFALPWRGLLEGAGFPVEWCVSAQPWVSARAWLLLLGGLAWAGWCMGQAWTKRERRVIAEGLAVGIGVIAAVALAGRHGSVPGWPPGTGLGPFANRNQTAALFAVGGLLTVACGVERFRAIGRGGAGRAVALGVGWACLLGVYTAALAVNRSRAGPVLFVAMTLAWLLAATPPRKRKPETIVAGAAVALLLATVFLLTGRAVMARLAGSGVMDFRLKIYSDALRMIRASPWTGTGLGCFNAIFPLYRNASALQERVLHPESDWLWLAAEAGLPCVLAVAGLLGWMGTLAWKGLARAEDRAMRLALCVACAGVLAHSFVDVPGHRLGTLMPAALLLGLAACGQGAGERWCGGMLRGVGALGLAGGACFGVMASRVPPLDWTPLDWRLCAQRAEAEGGRGEFTAALADFRRARFLEPDYAGLPYEEGIFWLGVAPRFATEAWAEALRRVPAERRAEMYQNILANSFASHPELHAALWALAARDAQMQLVYLGWAAPEEFTADLDDLLRQDASLARFDTGQLRGLFTLWMNKGDPARLAGLIGQSPQWLKAGYRMLAEYDASREDFADAVNLMETYLPPPPMPRTPLPAMSHAEAAQRFQGDNGDVAAGMALYGQALAAGREAEALDALRRMSGNLGCPAYVHYLEGQLLVKQGKLADAWAALEKL